MFDANVTGVPVGNKFFVEVHSVNSELCKMGVVVGDILLCEHFSKTPFGKWSEEACNTKIWTKQDKESGHYFYNDTESETGYGLMVYSGCPDGTGFIDEEWRQKALDFLGGEWYA